MLWEKFKNREKLRLMEGRAGFVSQEGINSTFYESIFDMKNTLENKT